MDFYYFWTRFQLLLTLLLLRQNTLLLQHYFSPLPSLDGIKFFYLSDGSRVWF